MNLIVNFKKVLIFIIIVGGLLIINSVSASMTDGTIDSTYKYAWGENIGWVNFGCSNCNVRITDSALTGYVWSENYGWINLAPTASGVGNDNEGHLSGYAWGENLGWIDFSGVTINSSGEFTGYASGTVTGQINFDCANCKVKTDWRPRSARLACNNSSDDDSDGKIDYPNDPGCDSLNDTSENDLGGGVGGGGMPSPKAPEGGFKVLINNDAEYTDSSIVILSLFGGPEAARMEISNNPEFTGLGSTGQIPYQSSYQWNLCQGKASCPGGGYTVYVKFYAPWGSSSETVSDSIIYKKEEPIAGFIEKIPEIIKKIPEIFKLKPPEEEALLFLQKKWNLLSYTQFNLPFIRFTLAPLPREFQKLTEKFPELRKTFADVDIQRLIDIRKLKAVKLTLPGLTERLGLLTAKIEPGKFALPRGVPIAELSSEIKELIPTEIVFARTSGELIDFNIVLSVTEKGELQQRISTISGKSLQLVVKPEKPVKSVKGYVVFKSKTPRLSSFQFPFSHLTASLIFANPIFAKLQEQPVRVEEKLVLLEFEYTDPDGDGIYTAEIQAPLIEGEYEIITVFDFEEPKLGKKEIRLITVVDPEGYIYEKGGGKETRIPGAIVSLFWLNPETKQYELWPAEEYQQENPQITDVKGTYSFLVPEGYYYLKVEAPGYPVYEGKPFQVKEGSGIHNNIELKTKYWWLKIVDWETILLAAVVILLFYNFYRDRIREGIKK